MTNAPFRMTQGMDVLPPKTGNAYPIPCQEWDNLRSAIGGLTNEPWFFHTSGSLLVGIGLSTGIAAAIGGVKEDPAGTYHVIAWAIAIASVAIGAACLFFAQKERTVQRGQASNVVTLMELIEQRFERSPPTANLGGQEELNARHSISQLVSQLAESDQRLRSRDFKDLVSLTVDDRDFRISAKFGQSTLTTGGALSSIRGPKDYLDVLVRSFDAVEAKRKAKAEQRGSR